jgi:F0F1-type ATP synthase membrane subunit a
MVVGVEKWKENKEKYMMCVNELAILSFFLYFIHISLRLVGNLRASPTAAQYLRAVKHRSSAR